jgi:hypothetical protein
MVGIISDGDPLQGAAPSDAAERYAQLPVGRPGGAFAALPEIWQSGLAGGFGRAGELAGAEEQADPAESLRQGRRLAGIPESEDTPQTYAGLQAEPKIDPREAQKRYAPNGEVSFDKPVAPSVAAVMADQGKRKAQRDAVLSRWANTTGVVPRLGVSAVASVLDPLNDAAFLVPGIGEESFLAGMGRLGLATTGLPARVAARALSGAASADIGTLPLIGLQAIQSRAEGDDFTIRDAMSQLAYNAAIGAVMHAGIGVASRRWRAGIIPAELPAETIRPETEMREAQPTVPPPVDAASVREIEESPAVKTQAAMSSAVAQMVDGREVDVRPVVAAEKPTPQVAFQFKPTGTPEVDRILQSPELQGAIAAPQGGRIDAADPAKINRANRVPYGAGASNTTDITNVDEHVPPVIVLNGVHFDPAIPVSIHEQVEKTAMEMLMKRGMSREDAYTTAHHLFAEPAERQWVEAHGIDWTGYQRWWASVLPSIEHENPENLPPDLYRKPYPHLEPQLAQHEPAGPVPEPTPAERRFVGEDAAPQGPSIMRFLASMGGLKPDPELLAINVPFRHLRKGGVSLDYAREAAAEAGYFPQYGSNTEAMAQSTPADLLDLIDRAVRGEHVNAFGDAPERRYAEPAIRDRFEHEVSGFMRENDLDETDKELVKRTVDLLSSGHETDIDHAIERATIQLVDEALTGDERADIESDLPGAIAESRREARRPGEGRAEAQEAAQSGRGAAQAGGEDAGVVAATERGAEGKPQIVIPGAERRPGELAWRLAEQRLGPRLAQQAADIGLFGDEGRQTDLMDLVRRPQPPATLPELAGQQADMYARGFAPGIPQTDFDAMNEAVYGKEAEKSATEAEKPKAAAAAAAHPLDAEIADLERQLAGQPLAPDDIAELEQSGAAVASADMAASGYEQAAQCLVEAGI